MEVIAYLKKEEGQKEQEIDALKQQVKDIRVTAHNERDSLIAEHEQKVLQLEGALNEKNEEVCGMGPVFSPVYYVIVCLHVESVDLDKTNLINLPSHSSQLQWL